MTEALTPAQKRTATRRANAEKRAQWLAERNAADTAVRALDRAVNAPAKRHTREEEAFLVSMVEAAQRLLDECRAHLAEEEGRGRDTLRQQPVVSLAEWRRATA